MNVQRAFLFVGGPLHAQVKMIDQSQAEVWTPSTVDEVGPVSTKVVSRDPMDYYPESWTDLMSGELYMRRTLAHVPNNQQDRTGYRLHVFVWTGVDDLGHAQALMGDAVMHRYFIEHGDAQPVEPRANGNAQSGLIVPGR